MSIHYSFRPHLHITRIVVVGLGGTGSQWARSIARALYHLRQARRHIPSLTFVDPDRIEEKNVGRQMFTEADVGSYKAEVLAKRFSRALGLDISFHNVPFDPRRHVERAGTLLCAAVDNHLARRELAAADTLWIDAGNHFSAGQVVCGNTNSAEVVQRALQHRGEMSYLPTAALLFPTLLEPEPTQQPAISCAQAVAQGDQHLLINELIATIAAHYTYKLLCHEPISSFITFCDADNLNVRSLAISPDNLRSYLS